MTTTGIAQLETPLDMFYHWEANKPDATYLRQPAAQDWREYSWRDAGEQARRGAAALRALGVTPHVAQNNKNRKSAIDDRTTRHPGYAISQIKRKCVEQVFGWGKEVGPTRKSKHRGVDRVDWMFRVTQAAYNLFRMRKLLCPT